MKELVTVLHFEQVTMPFENERPWHELFYELKHSEKTPGFFERLRFDWDGPYPRSRELSDFLHALHWNASVSAKNPIFDEISLTDDIADLWKKRLDSLEPGMLSFLNAASQMAKKKFEQFKDR